MAALLRPRLTPTPRRLRVLAAGCLAAGTLTIAAGMAMGNGPLIMVGLLLAGIANLARAEGQPPRGEAMHLERTELPGIGTAFRLPTETGVWIGVIRHRDGRRELVVYDRDDHDTASLSVALTPQEAHDLGTLLAARHPETLRG